MKQPTDTSMVIQVPVSKLNTALLTVLSQALESRYFCAHHHDDRRSAIQAEKKERCRAESLSLSDSICHFIRHHYTPRVTRSTSMHCNLQPLELECQRIRRHHAQCPFDQLSTRKAGMTHARTWLDGPSMLMRT